MQIGPVPAYPIILTKSISGDYKPVQVGRTRFSGLAKPCSIIPQGIQEFFGPTLTSLLFPTNDDPGYVHRACF